MDKFTILPKSEIDLDIGEIFVEGRHWKLYEPVEDQSIFMEHYDLVIPVMCRDPEGGVCAGLLCFPKFNKEKGEPMFSEDYKTGDKAMYYVYFYGESEYDGS